VNSATNFAFCFKYGGFGGAVNPATNAISPGPREVRRALVARGARHSTNRQRRLHESVIVFSQSVDEVIVITPEFTTSDLLLYPFCFGIRRHKGFPKI
jgi:hypothetical protein